MFLLMLSILSCSYHYRQELCRIAYVRSALSPRTSTYHERCLSQLALQKIYIIVSQLNASILSVKTTLMVLYPSIISILSPSSILSCHYMSLFYTLIIFKRKLNITFLAESTSLHCTALHCTALHCTS